MCVCVCVFDQTTKTVRYEYISIFNTVFHNTYKLSA